MGFSSFVTNDTCRSIPVCTSGQKGFPVYLWVPGVSEYEQDLGFRGFGEFGGTDFFEAFATANCLALDADSRDSLRDTAIVHYYALVDGEGVSNSAEAYLSPQITEMPWRPLHYEDIPQPCPHQGFLGENYKGPTEYERLSRIEAYYRCYPIHVQPTWAGKRYVPFSVKNAEEVIPRTVLIPLTQSEYEAGHGVLALRTERMDNDLHIIPTSHDIHVWHSSVSALDPLRMPRRFVVKRLKLLKVFYGKNRVGLVSLTLGSVLAQCDGNIETFRTKSLLREVHLSDATVTTYYGNDRHNWTVVVKMLKEHYNWEAREFKIS